MKSKLHEHALSCRALATFFLVVVMILACILTFVVGMQR